MKKKICIMLSFLLLFIMAGCGSEGGRKWSGKHSATNGWADRAILR